MYTAKSLFVKPAKIVFRLNIISNISFMIITIVLMLLFEGFDFFGYFLSILGTNELGWIFNVSLIMIAITTFLFFINVFLIFNTFERYLRYTLLILGMISSFSLVCIALFVTGGSHTHLHDLFALLYFSLLVPEAIIFLRLFQEQRYKIELSYLAIFIAMITFLALFVPMVNQFVFQKIVVYTSSTLVVLFSYHILRNEFQK